MTQPLLDAQCLADTALAALRDAAAATADAGSFTPLEADRLMRTYQRIGRVASAAETVLISNVTSSEVWKGQGHATPADYIAAVNGSSIGAAKGAIATSGALADLPATRHAMLAGELSAAQGQIVADAAKANPAAESGLIGAARRGRSNRDLREDALRAKAAADADAKANHDRIHKGRRCSTHTDAEHAWHLHATGTVLDGSIVTSELTAVTDALFQERRATGEQIESRDSLQFDALVRVFENSRALREGDADDHLDAATYDDGDVTNAEPGSPAATSSKRRGLRRAGRTKRTPAKYLGLLHLDVTALQRGWVEGDERCEIPGLGPIPVQTARGLLGDTVLKLVMTKGKDVINVTSLTRRPTQAMLYALLWTDPTCSVEGCSRTRIEFDHVYGAEWVRTHQTTLPSLRGKCTHHHRLHTNGDWELEPGSGKQPIRPPDHPNHPANARSALPAPEPPEPPPPDVGRTPLERAQQIALDLAEMLEAAS